VRITVVVHQFPPRYFTGTESYALAVGTELQRRGHDVDVFALDPAFGEATGPWRESREVVEGLPVLRVNFWMLLGPDWARLEYRHPLMAARFGEHLRERRTELVHSFHLRHVGADLIDVARLAAVPVVVSLTDFWFLCRRVTLMRSDGTPCDGPPAGGLGCIACDLPELDAELRAEPRAAELIAHAAEARENAPPGLDLQSRTATLLARAGYLRARLLAANAIVAPTRFLAAVFARNGVPAERIEHQPYGIDVGALQRRDGVATRPLTFGFLGSFSAHKGPDLLVDAFLRVRGECRLLLRGRTADFAEYSAALLRAAAADPRITVLPEYARAELPGVLASIDVLVAPSRWHENAPFVVLEARAAGLPVVGSAFGGLQEVVRDGVDGDLFAPGDVGALAACLQRLVDEPQRLARYRAAVQPPTTLAAAVDAFEATYERAVRA
jgi:glycosyltransferase involved in cell wall biosynthesis